MEDDDSYSDEDAKLPPRMYRPDIPLVWGDRNCHNKHPLTVDEQFRHCKKRGLPYFSFDLLPCAPDPETSNKYPGKPFVARFGPPPSQEEIDNAPPFEPYPERHIPPYIIPENQVQIESPPKEEKDWIMHVLRPQGGGRAKVIRESKGDVWVEPITSFEATVVRCSFDHVAFKPVFEVLETLPASRTPSLLSGYPVSASGTKDEAGDQLAQTEEVSVLKPRETATTDSKLEDTASASGNEDEVGDQLAQMSMEGPVLKPCNSGEN